MNAPVPDYSNQPISDNTDTTTTLFLLQLDRQNKHYTLTFRLAIPRWLERSRFFQAAKPSLQRMTTTGSLLAITTSQ